MAGRENQSNLWVLFFGLDLQPPFVCAGVRTLFLASLQKHNWEQRHTFNANEKSSRSSMNLSMFNHVSEKRFYIFKMIKTKIEVGQ